MIVSRGGPLRVPAVVSARHWPDVVRRIAEKQPLVTPESWCRTQSSIEPRTTTESDRAATAVTTPSWFYVREADGLGEENLFLKPDDLCDANDVSRLRRDVVDELSED
jgi:hypothetical protein